MTPAVKLAIEALRPFSVYDDDFRDHDDPDFVDIHVRVAHIRAAAEALAALLPDQARIPEDRERLASELDKQAEWGQGYLPTVAELMRKAAAALRQPLPAEPAPADGSAEATREAAARWHDVKALGTSSEEVRFTHRMSAAAIRAMPLPSGWRPIAEAPKDAPSEEMKLPRHDLAAQVKTLGADSLLPPEEPKP